MPALSNENLKSLIADVKGLKDSTLVGVLVGDGSMILNFANGSSILLQCPFKTAINGVSATGHGEDAETAIHLFALLNTKVVDAAVDESGLITLKFSRTKKLRICPDGSGFESYVMRTSNGVSPVY
jgi:hypothetical protein